MQTVLTLPVAVAVSLCISTVLGYETYQNNIPNGKSVPSPSGGIWGGVGHKKQEGGGDFNQFGVDFKNNNHVWNAALCNKDSDGDGQTNGQELGDPQCQWTQGGSFTPDPATGHPGVPEATLGPLENVKITAVPVYGEAVNMTDRIWKVDANSSVRLICVGSPNNATGKQVEYRFLQGTTEVVTWMTNGNNHHMLSAFDSTQAGEYFCEARLQKEPNITEASAPIILTLACTTGDNCTDADTRSKCDGDANKEYCQCQHGPGAGVFPGCFVCGDNDAGCTAGDTPKCSPVVSGGRKCVACLAAGNAGCDAASKTPRCDVSGKDPVCANCRQTDNFPCAGTAKPVCLDSGACGTAAAASTSGTTTTQGSANGPSSAGTVTSTICLVILASVVTLIN